MDDGIRELSADPVIQAGGWHPRYARVLLVEHDYHDAVILVDGNGDGAELELEYWHHGDDGLWHGGSTFGHGPLGYLPTFQAWNAGPFVAAVGCAPSSTKVSVEYNDRLYLRAANEFGIWGFVHATDSLRADELPTMAGSPPLA
jgi:hypothetical protein